MKYIKMALFAIILTTSGESFAEYNFSDSRIKNMQKAYQYGKSNHKKPFKGDHNIGYIMAAIIWQESSCGTNIKNGNAVGAFQNYVPTVQSRLNQQGIKKSHSQISKELTSFDRSAHWANVELEYWLTQHRGNMHRALASYNAGNTKGGGRYASSIMQKANYLKTNNVLKVR